MSARILTSLIGLGINQMQNRINLERMRGVNEAFNLSTKTMSLDRGFYGPGGKVISRNSPFVVSQMDKGERFISPDLKIYESKSKKKHEDMDDEEITDILSDGSFAFSERKFFTPGDYEDDILGYGIAHYEEDDDFELEEVNLAQVYNKPGKEISLSEGIGGVEKYFKTKDDKDKNIDIFDKITNQENVQARTPYVSKLMEIHRGDTSKNSPIIPQKFGYGGKVKKYRDGDEVVQTMYEDELERLDDLDAQSDQMFLLGGIQGAQSTINNRVNNTLGLAVDTIGTALQDAQVDPALVDTSLADDMFEEISNATADQISNTGFGRANSLVSNVASRNPQMARRMAPSLLGAAVDSSNRARLGVVRENLAQRRGKYSFLNNANNLNRRARRDAKEATDDLVNRKIGSLAAAGNRFLSNESLISANNLDFSRRNLGQLNKNRLITGNARRSLIGDRMNFEIQRQAQRDFYDRFDKMQGGAPGPGGASFSPIPDDVYDIYDYQPLPGSNSSNLG